MGDFGEQTAVERVGEGRYRAVLHRDWEIWGPMGGYVAAVAARAAGAEAVHPRPASFFCHYLGVARFEPVDLHVDVVRRGRSAETLRVTMIQGDRPVLDATVSVVATDEGLEHDEAEAPDVAGPHDLPTRDEQYALAGVTPPPTFPFWSNFDGRSLDFHPAWPPDGPLDPRWRSWLRFEPRSTFDDPWTDVGRYLVLTDLPSWPAAIRRHAHEWPEGQPPWVAPSLDLYVAFHRLVPAEPWLLVVGEAPLATDGLLPLRSTLWSEDRHLVASGTGQCLFRRIPAG